MQVGCRGGRHDQVVEADALRRQSTPNWARVCWSRVQPSGSDGGAVGAQRRGQQRSSPNFRFAVRGSSSSGTSVPAQTARRRRRTPGSRPATSTDFEIEQARPDVHGRPRHDAVHHRVAVAGSSDAALRPLGDGRSAAAGGGSRSRACGAGAGGLGECIGVHGSSRSRRWGWRTPGRRSVVRLQPQPHQPDRQAGERESRTGGRQRPRAHPALRREVRGRSSAPRRRSSRRCGSGRRRRRPQQQVGVAVHEAERVRRGATRAPASSGRSARPAPSARASRSRLARGRRPPAWRATRRSGHRVVASRRPLARCPAGPRGSAHSSQILRPASGPRAAWQDSGRGWRPMLPTGMSELAWPARGSQGRFSNATIRSSRRHRSGSRVDGGPQAVALVVLHDAHPPPSAGRKHRRQPSSSTGRGGWPGAGSPPRLAARGRGQPAADRHRVDDGGAAAYQRQPGGLDDVLGDLLRRAGRRAPRATARGHHRPGRRGPRARRPPSRLNPLVACGSTRRQGARRTGRRRPRGPPLPGHATRRSRLSPRSGSRYEEPWCGVLIPPW